MLKCSQCGTTGKIDACLEGNRLEPLCRVCSEHLQAIGLPVSSLPDAHSAAAAAEPFPSPFFETRDDGFLYVDDGYFAPAVDRRLRRDEALSLVASTGILSPEEAGTCQVALSEHAEQKTLMCDEAFDEVLDLTSNVVWLGALKNLACLADGALYGLDFAGRIWLLAPDTAQPESTIGRAECLSFCGNELWAASSQDEVSAVFQYLPRESNFCLPDSSNVTALLRVGQYLLLALRMSDDTCSLSVRTPAGEIISEVAFDLPVTSLAVICDALFVVSGSRITKWNFAENKLVMERRIPADWLVQSIAGFDDLLIMVCPNKLVVSDTNGTQRRTCSLSQPCQQLVATATHVYFLWQDLVSVVDKAALPFCS